MDSRKPFAENIASGLQGFSLSTTAFLYLFAAIVLVPLSILSLRVSGQKTSPYLIPLLVLLFIAAEYLYCWRLLFKSGPARPLFGVGILASLIYACYRVPADFMDRSWSHFEVLHRALWWVFGGTVVRSILAPLALLVGYCALYYGFRIRGRRFIVVSDFRVWGKQAEKFPKEGVAARLQDELMRLCAEMKTPNERKLVMSVGSVASSPGSDALLKSKRGPSRFYSGGFSLPETQVTLQYEGISFEGLHTFIRRRTGREVVISGDLISHSRGLLLAARTLDDGPWEVRVSASNSVALGFGLRKLALRIMTTLTHKFEPQAANAFVVLQIIAGELHEYDQALDLARLGWQAAPDPEIANRNLASALNDLGIDLGSSNDYDEAITRFKEATILDPRFEEAHENLGRAYKLAGNQTEADEAFRKAKELKAAQNSPIAQSN